MKQLLLVIALLIGFTSYAQDIPDRPDEKRLVHDFANVLSPEEVNQLERVLDDFALRTSNEIAVVTVPSLNGYDVGDFAFRLGEKWGVGKANKDNGVVVLFKPKTADSKGQVFVAVGYGLEGVIPDAIANRDIVDSEMIPRFKQGDIFGGLYKGVEVIMALSAGEFTADEYHKQVQGKTGSGAGIIVLIFFVFFIISVFSKRRSYYSGGSSLPFWLLMGSMMSNSHHRGSWGNFSGGSGGFSSGGGFGGFGGGSFGGGGAGGSW